MVRAGPSVGQGFLAAENGENVEDAGDVDWPVSAARSGWASWPSFAPDFSALFAHGGLRRRHVPGGRSCSAA